MKTYHNMHELKLLQNLGSAEAHFYGTPDQNSVSVQDTSIITEMCTNTNDHPVALVHVVIESGTQVDNLAQEKEYLHEQV